MAYTEANRDSKLPILNFGDPNTLASRLELVELLLDQSLVNFVAFLALNSHSVEQIEQAYKQIFQSSYEDAQSLIETQRQKAAWENEGKSNTQSVSS